jgi:hypothetical protein
MNALTEGNKMTKYEKEKEQNLIAYKQLRTEILQKHKGKYVAIAKGKLVAVAPTFDEAVEASQKAVPDFLHRFVFQAGYEPITEALYVSTNTSK